MRTITSNDEAAAWRRSNLRLLPSSDDSDNIFHGTLLRTLG
jgi:hypothetical protein